MKTGFYTCTLLPEVTRDDPPKLGVRCNETGVCAAFWREEDRALFFAVPDMLEVLEAAEKAFHKAIYHASSTERKTLLSLNNRVRAAIAKARGNAVNLGEK